MDMLSSSKITRERGSLVHVAPACAGSGEGSNHFGSYARSLSLHFGKRLFPGLEPMNSKKRLMFLGEVLLKTQYFLDVSRSSKPPK
jgi:hypothetical protein